MMIKNKSGKQHWFLFYSIVLGMGALLSIQSSWQPGLRVSVLDVGQGDAILIQTPEYKNILIDTGPEGQVIDRLGEEFGFFERTVDLLILTHPDQDHVGGAIEVIQKYPVKNIMLTGVASPNKSYAGFLEAIRTRAIPMIIPVANQDLKIGRGLYLDIVYPLKNQSFFGQTVKAANNTSVAFRLRQWDAKTRGWRNWILLPGDAERPEELEILLSGQELVSDVLKLGHHGSKTSTSEEWLKAIRPKTVIVSTGLNNPFGHPHAEVVERVYGLEIKNTAYDGTVRFAF